MVCLNDNIPVNYIQMKKLIALELNDIIEHELYYIEDIDEEKKDKIKKNIVKEMKNKLNTDFFIYRIINNNYCTFKHAKGKKEGYFCCKRITENGDNENFVCTIHNKKHIPKKKVGDINKINTKNINNKPINNFNDIIKINNQKIIIKSINNENDNFFKLCKNIKYNIKNNTNTIKLSMYNNIMNFSNINKIPIFKHPSFFNNKVLSIFFMYRKQIPIKYCRNYKKIMA